jgi:beta-lactamase class A
LPLAGVTAAGQALAATRATVAPHHHTLSQDIRAYLATRHGAVSVAVFDRVSHEQVLVHPADRMHTASIVKADILETLLHRTAGHLGANQKELARRMIEVSDNDAASALWREVRGHAGLDRYDAALGLHHTTPAADGRWGLTTTSAADQVAVVRELLTPSALLSTASRRYERKLMRRVRSDQRWGISGGVPDGVAVGNKNGWLPVRGDDYRWVVNSIGWVKGEGRSYVIAVLTAHEESEGYGIATIQHIAHLAWNHAAH